MENDGWIEWVWSEEKPYPESLDTMVNVKYQDDGEGLSSVGFLHNEDYEFSNWYNHNDSSTVTHYKLAEGN